MTNPNIQKLAKDLSKCVKSKPYNPFAAWNMSENDHTKYLLSILRYHDAHGNYPVLADFLLRFTKGKGSMAHYTCPKNVKIEFSHKTSSGEFNKQGFIDGLITFDGGNKKVGIIIENKIHGACDQPQQVRNYISHLSKSGFELKNIWVFYITNTNDGLKEVDKGSYDVEDEDEKTNIGSRFIAINYKEDITEWLQNDILNNRYYPESLTSIVRTYLDYLRNDLFCDDIDINLQNKLLEKLGIKDLNKLKLKDWETLIKLRSNEGVDNEEASFDTAILDSVLSSIFKRITALAFDNFERISIDILKKHWAKELKENDATWQVSHHSILGNGYLQFRLVNERGSAHIEWIPISVRSMLFETKYTITLHCEGNSNKKLLKEWIEELKPNLPTNGNIEKRGYSLKISSDTPLAKMSESELEVFLTKLYNETFEYPIHMLVRDFKEYKGKDSDVKELGAQP